MFNLLNETSIKRLVSPNKRIRMSLSLFVIISINNLLIDIFIMLGIISHYFFLLAAILFFCINVVLTIRFCYINYFFNIFKKNVYQLLVILAHILFIGLDILIVFFNFKMKIIDGAKYFNFNFGNYFYQLFLLFILYYLIQYFLYLKPMYKFIYVKYKLEDFWYLNHYEKSNLTNNDIEDLIDNLKI